MNFRTFVAKITIRQGEVEHTTHRLLVARNDAEACRLSDDVICMMYCEPDEAELNDGTVMVYGGEVALRVHSVREIGLSTFLEMRSIAGIPCYCAEGLYEPQESDLGELKGIVGAIHKALSAKQITVSHSQVLNAMASALGSRNWSQYKATAITRKDVEQLLAQCESVADASSNEGCEAPWTVTDGSAIEKMTVLVRNLKDKLFTQGN